MKKLTIVVVVVLVVVAASLLVTSPRGPSEPTTAQHPILERIRSLVPRHHVAPDDVGGAPCWNSDTGAFLLPPGGICQISLPEKANRLNVCLAEGQLSQLSIKGTDYAAQHADLGRLGCDVGGQGLDLYDRHSVLIMVCQAFAS